MTSATQWVAGARPRTLAAALAPVAAGTGAAAHLDAAQPLWAGLALAVAVALQIAVNYANDYSDGIRGTDTDRVGPFRLTGSGAATPQAVRRAAFLAFAAAALSGLTLIALSGQWWLLGLGVVTFPAAWWYTGGSSPYGYRGFGEPMVFVFFGLFAVLGTTYTQAGRVSWAAVGAAVGVGCYACAILVTNNLRDIPTDQASGKITLAVRLQAPNTRKLYLGLVLSAHLLLLPLAWASPWVLLAGAAAVVGWPAYRTVRGGRVGAQLIPALQGTGLAELSYGLLLGLGLALS